MKLVKVSWRVFASVITLLTCYLPMAASAAGLRNAGAYVAPTEAKAGQTVKFTNSVLADVAVTNATIQTEVRAVSATGVISSSAVLVKKFTNQTFKAGERRAFTLSYVVPATLAAGKYSYVIRGLSADGKTTYFTVSQIVSPYIFNVIGTVVAPQPTPSPSPSTPAPVAEKYVRGVNIMDLGISHSAIPGKYGENYTRPSLQNLKYIKSRGFDVVRLPFLWERMQHKLNGALDPAYLKLYIDTLKDADAAGLKTIVDFHNYGRYTHVTSSGLVETIIGDVLAPVGPTQAQYVDAWRKIAKAIRSDAIAYRSVYAYDLMNEPHDLVDIHAPFTKKVTIANFESSTDGFAGVSPVTLSRQARNGQMSLKVSVPVKKSDTTVIYKTTLAVLSNKILEANGNVFQVKGFIPATNEGTAQVRFYLVDGTSKMHVSGAEILREERNFAVNVFVPKAGFVGIKQLQMEILVNRTEGKNTAQVFYIDEINQGTAGATIRPVDVWVRFAQAALNGIRADGDKKLIMVEGYSWASAALWPRLHPKKFITDSANNLMYHAHLYIDGSAGGQYKFTFAEETAKAKAAGFASVAAQGLWRAQQFAEWCAREKVRCFIGEYGWPNSDTVGVAEARAWNQAGEQLLAYFDKMNLGATVWGTGSWLTPTGNILNTYQLEKPGVRSFLPLSQTEVIERHLGKK